VTTALPPSTTTTRGDLGFVPPPGNNPTSGLTEKQAREAKNDLVVEMPEGDSYLPSAESQEPKFTFELDPREGLAVTFTSAVETLKQNLANSILLGVTISILLLLGIDKREERASLTASPA
jgi:hypothetical protein